MLVYDPTITGGTGGGYSWAPSPAPAATPAPAPAPAPAATATVVPGGALEAWAAAQQAFQQAYLQDMLRYQDRWHAQQAAEQAAMRELQKQLALGYVDGKPTLERELGEGGLGLGYLQLLASQRGPGDWIQYWNTVRAAQQTSLPSWAASLAQGLNLPAYQGPRVQPPGLGASPWAAPAGANAEAAPGATLPAILPHQVTAQQWRNMLPSEREGLAGMVEAQGGWWPDFQQQMMAAFPTGTAGRRVVWG